jgi:hypothetical protein
MRNDFDLEDLSRIADPFADLASATDPPPPLRSKEAAPSRGRAHARQAAALVGALAYDVACLLWFQPHAGHKPAWALVAGSASPCAAGLLALAAATRKGPYGLGEPVGRVVLLSVVSLALFTCATSLASPPWTSAEPFLIETLRCLSLSTLFAAGPALLAAVAFRRAFAAASVARAAALGIACGALGSATMSVVCPDGGVVHLLLGHGLVLGTMGLLGALLGRRIAQA